ncbi:MAG: bifunctional (p)ppGpp synthetase/guanosine-3',5'-bis(diphosphate) 3'-pyrophosphohydrolase [Betaproteobacteria bacterium]|nr:bifunctional (p)ppGpp synthetase/guanosine-3',5'-bis(diphosphate) 3'-pyrophosphohydrolase [Betaproteobacteria bacterium]
MVTHALSHAARDAEGWLGQIAERYGADQTARIRRALDFLLEHEDALTADSGIALSDHALASAMQLAGMGLDADTVVAALIRGLPEAQLKPEQLTPAFGPAVNRLTQGCLSLARMDRLLSDSPVEGGQSEALRQMLLAMTDDIRVVLIKLADRACALRELAKDNEEKRRKAALETRELYAPLANRLGVWQLKWELEDLACRYLEPDTYKEIAQHLDEKRIEREGYIEQVIRSLGAELDKAGIKGAAISGRPKHIASILNKMRKKHLSFDEVYDVRAVRVLVRDVKDCYHVLGLVHQLWQPIPGQFDDYISRPKGNGYRSLHTAVIGPDDKALEVQIRTADMHQEAELGMAAHWRYKEGGGSGEKLQEKIAWLRQVLAWKNELADSAELAEQFKNELFHDEVFALTPQGRVVALAAGATPVDFAYAVHTELGHRCRGAKVDGVLMPLDTALKSGQRVEILTVKEGGPSRDWLNPAVGFLKTSRAQAKVRQWFRQQDIDTHIQEGRDLLEREIHRLGLHNVNLEKLAARLKFAKLDELFAALGRGDLGSGGLAKALQDEFQPAPAKPLLGRRKSKTSPSGVLIEGEAGMLTTLAGCCKPAPPEPIVGYTTQGRGVSIHRADCKVVARLPDARQTRLMHAAWGKADNQVFAIDIEVLAHDRAGLLKDITEVFVQEKVNVVRVNTLSHDGGARMEFTGEVRDIGQLSRCLGRLAHVRGVFQARRK